MAHYHPRTRRHRTSSDKTIHPHQCLPGRAGMSIINNEILYICINKIPLLRGIITLPPSEGGLGGCSLVQCRTYPAHAQIHTRLPKYFGTTPLKKGEFQNEP